LYITLLFVFIIRDKARAKGNTGVGVMRDKKLKLEELKVSTRIGNPILDFVETIRTIRYIVYSLE